MIVQPVIITWLLFLTASFSLEHEKSFLIQDGSAIVWSMAVYQDSLIITTSNDIVQKDILTAGILRTFRAHPNVVRSIVVTADSKMISAGWDDKVILWDLVTGSILRRIWLGAPNTVVTSVSLQNSWLFTGGEDRKVRQLDMITGKVTKITQMNTDVSSIIADGDFLFIGLRGDFNQIEKFRISSMSSVSVFGSGSSPVNVLYLYDNILYSGFEDSVISCWNADNGDLIRQLVGHSYAISAIFVIHETVYSGDVGSGIKLWNKNDGRIIRSLRFLHINIINVFALKEEMLFSGSTDTNIISWNASTGELILGRKTKLWSAVHWKNLVISSGDDATVKMWDKLIDSLEPFAVLVDSIQSVTSLCISDDTLFTGSSDTYVRQWNLTDFTRMKFLSGHSHTVSFLVIVDEYLFSAGYDKAIVKWDKSTGSNLGVLLGHTLAVGYLAFKENILYSGSVDGFVKMWNTETDENIWTYYQTFPIFSILVNDDTIITGNFKGLLKISVPSGDIIAEQADTASCNSMISSKPRLYSGHLDGSIKVWDLDSLYGLSTYYGHQNSVQCLTMDASGVLFSASFDGSLKKWNVVTGKIAFSFEYRNASVTALAVAQNHLFIGSKQGLVDRFAVDSGFSSFYYFFHMKAVSSFSICGDFIYSSGLDGSLVKLSLVKDSEPVLLYRPTNFPIKSLQYYLGSLLAIENDLEIVSFGINGTIPGTKLLSASVPLACLEIDGSTLYAGSVSGSILAWDIILVQPVVDLKGHTSKVNFLTAYQGMLYSASYDNTIIEWSLTTKAFVKQFKRLSSTALGHLGPVNSLSICNGVLFSAGSDTTVRRWNILSAKHEDVYFGFSKPVTTVVCMNSSVFAGSEDFAVLMFKPSLPRENPISSILSQKLTISREKFLKRVFKPSSVGTEASSRQSVIIPVFSLGVFLVIALVGLLIRKKYNVGYKQTIATATDLNTIVNSIMGVSKHAEFLIENSSVAKLKKIAAGGGGVVYTAKLMDQKFGRRAEGYVIQKEVFARSKVHEEAFYQEVGIMIMLSTFPNFCKIIAFTENPLSIILNFYPDGSLSEWLNKHKHSLKTTLKIAKEITGALNVMHSHYLAHCDIKAQNILIQMEGGVPSCYLTDFGITQILSEKIIATKSFHVINLRGLSIQYASPEALRNFRSKKYVNVDFKMYDVFSLACVTYEVLTRRAPWD
ncbi:hypothetical protein MP638_005244 [Amoeboaphelidium occidentale]|nr:hypothetical protein MP638_005244 [Amoeboaphelidium occidentale]